MKSSPKSIAPSKASAYRDAFITHVHTLLWTGYLRLDRSTLKSLDEPAISGLICKSIEDLLDDSDSPDWTDDYEIHDDPPVHNPERRGKHRRRVDIKLQSRRTRPRLRFCFEAKLLKTNASISGYLGADGLGRYLDGSYSSDQSIGGMIAYVQTEDCGGWSSKISAKIDTTIHRIKRNGSWVAAPIIADLKHTYRTIHERANQLKSIDIIHTFLDCTGQ